MEREQPVGGLRAVETVVVMCFGAAWRDGRA